MNFSLQVPPGIPVPPWNLLALRISSFTPPASPNSTSVSPLEPPIPPWGPLGTPRIPRCPQDPRHFPLRYSPIPPGSPEGSSGPTFPSDLPPEPPIPF